MSETRKIVWNIFALIGMLMIVSMIVSKLLTGWSSIFSFRSFFIVSESMEPQIGVNQLVLGKYVPDSEELEIGEIYAYRRDGFIGQEIIIHRLIAIAEDGRCQFKGDNNELPDTELVERENIGYQIIRY